MHASWSSCRASKTLQLSCCLVLLVVAAVAPASGGEASHDTVADRSSPWLLLDDGRPMTTASVALAKQLAGAEPRSLAAADLDRNGVPDLLVGLAGPDAGGVLVVHAGDPDTYPARGEVLPFLPKPRSFAIPLDPDWIAAGDFDGDGHQDLVAAARHEGRLALLAGDGAGDLAAPVLVDLPGPVTVLAAGDVNRRDGLMDLVLGIGATSDRGARLLVYESPLGALRGRPEVFDLPAPATAVAIGRLLAGGEHEIAVAAGSEVVVLAGRDRKLTWTRPVRDRVPSATAERLDLGAPVTGVAFGRFTGSDRRQLAVTTDGGGLTLLQRDGGGTAWHRHKQLDPVAAGRLLTSARISAVPHHDLVLDLGDGNLLVRNLAGAEGEPVSSRIASAAAVVAVLPVRLNLDALADLVLLVKGEPTPLVLTTRAATTFTVNSTNDVYDQTCNAHCSLRDAIRSANLNPGLDTIKFSVGYGTITLTSTMIPITEAVVIDGLQGVCPTTCHLTDIDASAAGANAIVLPVDSGTTVTYLQIRGANGEAIKLDGDGNTVSNCRLGVDWAGDADPNGTGLLVQSSADNVIGGSSGEANTISGNTESGIRVTGGSASTNNTITGNYLGTDLWGNSGIGNDIGILIDTLATGNTIGSSAAPNVISGNTSVGVQLGSENGAAMDNLVVANFIGIDGDGASRLSNGAGIEVFAYSSGTTIGGTTSDLGNVISGNLGTAIAVRAEADSTTIQGNLIGVAGDGSTVQANGGIGVLVEEADSCLVGGTVNAAGNTISGNGSWGIAITGNGSDPPTGNTVLRNLIGTDSTEACRGNGAGGIRLTGQSNSIGSADHLDRNSICCNDGPGISLGASGTYATAGNVIAGNRIGRIRTGVVLPNTGNGITIYGAATGTTVGLESARNIIADNGGAGIVVSGSGGSLPQDNTLRFNEISDNGGLGIDLAGSTAGDGVTANDGSPDADTGPNGRQNYPVITDIDKVAKTVSISLESLPNTTFTIDVWNAGPECDSSHHGEAPFPLGSTTLTTGGDGTGTATASFVFDFDDKFIVATATDPDGNTSELSECFWEGRGLVSAYIFHDDFEYGITGLWSVVVGEQL